MRSLKHSWQGVAFHSLFSVVSLQFLVRPAPASAVHLSQRLWRLRHPVGRGLFAVLGNHSAVLKE